MSGLIKRELYLTLIPDVLAKDFEDQVIEAYCDMRWLDLHHIAFIADDFCVYTHSYELTGKPYELSDDPTMADADFADIKETRFNELLSDVFEVLRFHNMFHAWNDLDEGDGTYSHLVGLTNIPIKGVW